MRYRPLVNAIANTLLVKANINLFHCATSDMKFLAAAGCDDVYLDIAVARSLMVRRTTERNVLRPIAGLTWHIRRYVMMNLTHSAQLHGSDHIGHSAVWTQLRTRFSRLATAWADHRKLARDRQILNDFNDRQLWDIGISRSDIPAVLSGTFHRD
jgi:uncharacterized protein YjiS (DUF1127 family)